MCGLTQPDLALWKLGDSEQAFSLAAMRKTVLLSRTLRHLRKEAFTLHYSASRNSPKRQESHSRRIRRRRLSGTCE
jgi:hypothetical protein